MLEIPCTKCGKNRNVHCRLCAATSTGLCRSCARPPNLLAATRARQAEIDLMAVERLLAGQPVRSTRAERQAAVAYLTEHRMSNRLIAERLRISQRTAERLRTRSRKEAA